MEREIKLDSGWYSGIQENESWRDEIWTLGNGHNLKRIYLS